MQKLHKRNVSCYGLGGIEWSGSDEAGDCLSGLLQLIVLQRGRDVGSGRVAPWLSQIASRHVIYSICLIHPVKCAWDCVHIHG
jgi:hypothetical protein